MKASDSLRITGKLEEHDCEYITHPDEDKWVCAICGKEHEEHEEWLEKDLVDTFMGSEDTE